MLSEPIEYNAELHLAEASVNEMSLNQMRFLQIAAMFQMRDCFPHHSMTEMSLSHA